MRTSIIVLSITSILIFHNSAFSQQQLTTADKARVAEANSLAGKFIERFAAIRDFKTVWNEFHSSDQTCALEFMKLDGDAAAPFAKLSNNEKPDNLLKRKLFYSYWNFFLLGSAYLYSSIPTPKDHLPDFALLPDDEGTKSIKWFESTAKFVNLVDTSSEPQEIADLKDLKQFVVEMDGFSTMIKTHLPRDTMKNDNWRSFVTYVDGHYHSPSMIVPAHGERNSCIKKNAPIFQVTIADIYFLFVVEKGKLRLLSLAVFKD